MKYKYFHFGSVDQILKVLFNQSRSSAIIMFHCSYCNYQTSSKQLRKQHEQAAHEEPAQEKDKKATHKMPTHYTWTGLISNF